jgi:hypothetical protein
MNVIAYFYVITYVMRFTASLNNVPLPLQIGRLTFGAVRTC